MSSGASVSIPSSVCKTIQNIKEITGNHSEEEIYAMLKECSMDPNETTQKLLLQDTFHEVKRKRDRRKENMNKEAPESSWKPGMQGRGNRAGRRNYPPRYMSQDVGGGKNSASGKENGMTPVLEKGIGPTNLSTSQEMKSKETVSTASSLTITVNGPAGLPSGSSTVTHASDSTVGRMVNHSEVIADDGNNTLEGPPSIISVVDANKNLSSAFVTGETSGQVMLKSTSCLPSGTSVSSSEVYFSASDPVLLPSQDTRIPGSVGTIRREVENQRTPADQIAVTPAENKSSTASEAGSSFVQGKMQCKSQVGKNQLPESSGTSDSQPLSTYSSRSQQVIGPYKVGPTMEWKPKPANPSQTQGPGTAVSSYVLPFSVEIDDQSQPAVIVTDSKETSTLELVKKLEDSHISDGGQHVIIPNHLHVPEAEKLGFCFGSFDASFGINTSYSSGHASEKSSTPLSETSEETEENGEEHSSSDQNAMGATGQQDYGEQRQSSSDVPENIPSGESNVSSTMVSEYGEPKQEMALPLESHQPSMVHTSSNYSFGVIPPILGSHPTIFESSESQAHDVSRLPSFIVQQPLDPMSYYAQFYRSGADSDGRISPFHLPGVATKYNGNVAVLPPQASQSPQECGNSLVLSSGVPTPLATQAAGIIPSSIPGTQQQLPVFRQPTGMHLSHYPPNYIPYGHYFPPFYVPNPAIHQFLSNSAFPQQPLAGSVYPAPPAATAKYSLSQYKPGTNAGNSNHIGVAGNYGSFGSFPAGYNHSSAAKAGNSNSNENLAASQFKDHNAYITGQQSEGSGVWIAASGRDMSGMPASSFYNLPQGQLAFTPAQAGHGAFAGIYHPAQPVTASTVHPLLQQSQTVAGAIDMVGPTAGVYQQPQHTQMNFPNNY